MTAKTEIYGSEYNPSLFVEAIKEVAKALSDGHEIYHSSLPWTGETAKMDVNEDKVSSVDFIAINTVFTWNSPDGIPDDRIYSMQIEGSAHFTVSFLTETPIFISDFKVLTTKAKIYDFFFSRHELTIEGNVKRDLIYGGDGDDYLLGYGKGDTIYGGAGDDQIRGGDGNSSMLGDGADLLFGGSGYDEIRGGSGNDRISGGKDHDELYGNVGRDTFVFSSRSSNDTDDIADFNPAKDSIELDHSVFIGLHIGTLTASAFKIVTDLEDSGKEIDRSDRIIFDREVAELFYDRDGSGHRYQPVRLAYLHHDIHLDNFHIV